MSLLKKATMLGAAGTAASGSSGLYVEDVFSTYLYEGNGSTQTITNGIDLDGEGGLVWAKNRDTNGYYHVLQDTVQGGGKFLSSNESNSAANLSPANTFSSNGYSINTSGAYFNASSKKYVSWTFRKAPRFFDIVTYTGTGDNANRTVAHNLGMKPGFVVIKRIDSTGVWIATHRSLALNKYLILDYTYQASTFSANINDHTATHFSARGSDTSGGTFVAYLFAHHDGDGGFGENGDQDIIKCGSYAGYGTPDGPEINLGWEPQWLLIKEYSADGNSWSLYDMMRNGTMDQHLRPDAADTEAAAVTSPEILPLATGFRLNSNNGRINRLQNYIYIAIRRPMKTPTSGSEVFGLNKYTETTDAQQLTTGNVVDLGWQVLNGDGYKFFTRLLGAGHLSSSSTAGLNTSAATKFDYMDGFAPYVVGGVTNFNPREVYGFTRAPSFFDVVCFTSPAYAVNAYTHSLGVTPELYIVKRRDDTSDWAVYSEPIGNTKYLKLQSSHPEATGGYWGNTSPTSTQFYWSGVTSATYVAYLFASVPGVSKVGSYTGNGTSQNIDCGFSTGARFVLIKRTDDGGDWHVWDTDRGIVTGNDPFLELNTTNAENSSYDSVDPYSAGFSVNQDIQTSINVSSGTYIFLAIS